MERYEKIINNINYIKHAKDIAELEKTRIFCKHTSNHSLDVARIAYLINIDEGYELKKDVVYAAAILHDIGRDVEYNEGTPHEEASALIAKDILATTDYDEAEKTEIINAVRNHRTEKIKNEKSLSGLIYRADKLSRACFACLAYNECNKAYDKRNDSLIW